MKKDFSRSINFSSVAGSLQHTVATVAVVIVVVLCGQNDAAAMERMSKFLDRDLPTLRTLAQSYLNRGMPDSASYCLTVLLTKAEAGHYGDLPASELAYAYMAKGALLASIYGNYSEGAVNLIKAQEIADKTGDTSLKAAIAYNLGAIQYEQRLLTGDTTASEKLLVRFREILGMLNLKKNSDLVATLLQSATEIGIQHGRPEVAEQMFAMLPPRVALPASLAKLRTIVGYVDHGDYSRAIDAIDQAIAVPPNSKSLMATEYVRSCRVMRAHLLLRAGREKEALEAYKELTAGPDADAHLFSNFEIYAHLRQYYSQKGDKEATTRFKLLEYETKDRLINRSHALSVEASRALFNEQKMRRDIVEHASRARVFEIVAWISAAFFVMLCVILLLLWRKYRQLRESRNIIARNDRDYFARDRHTPSTGGKDAEDPQTSQEGLYNRILKVTNESQEIYDEEFSTARLAELVGAKPGEVSTAIMEATGQTTTQFLARARIREACRRISDTEDYGDYTLEAIGQSVGYRSRSHFGAVFKKYVGMMPSQYASKMKR